MIARNNLCYFQLLYIHSKPRGVPEPGIIVPLGQVRIFTFQVVLIVRVVMLPLLLLYANLSERAVLLPP